MIHITDTEKSEIAELYNDGYSMKHIGEKFYLSRSTVSKTLRGMGISANARRSVKMPHLTADIVRLYNSGLSVSQIALEVPLSEGCIRQRLINASVQMRPRKISESKAEKIRDLYAQCIQFDDIGRQCGVSKTTVKKYTKDIKEVP